MRKLVILRGAMGCGKSTFIKEHNLENFTLSSDQIRIMFNSPQMNINYREEIPQFNNKKVWELLHFILEERMKKGEFTVVDAVHANCSESLTIYKKFAEKYRYRMYIVDFTDIPKEEVYKRNLNREEYKIVPEYSIDRVYKVFSKEKISSAFKIIKPEEFNDIINTKPRNFDKYEKVHIIGDIHGCYSALKKYFDTNSIDKDDAYIFVGDYFDRGIENYATFRYLNELTNNENMVFLVGNHEDKLYKYACDDAFKMDYDIKNTIQEFENNGVKKSEIRGFIKKLSQISFINFGGFSYLINHGGIPYIPKLSLDFYSTNSFIYGIDNYDVDIDKLYNDYMEKEDNKIYQIHGHRNFFKIKYNNYKYSINLEGAIEHGGYLRILTLNKDGHYDYTEVKNDVYNSNLVEETNVYNLVEDLRKNKYVFERDLGNDIYSFNFSKEAFYNKVWDNMTTQARGLFIDTKRNKIIARSYNKFFKINERKETNLDELENNLVFPVKFYLKYNGFLGILSINDGELFFATKSTNTGDYVEYFKTIFYQKYSDKQIKAFKDKMLQNNITIVFEVIDPINDPHIIEYREQNIVILDMIYNTTYYSKISYDSLKQFADDYNVEVKNLAYMANDLNEFKDIYANIIASDYQLNGEYVEGFVIEDNDNFMVKTKTNYYNTWKYIRTKMENALKNNDYTCKCKNQLEESFMQYLKAKYENIDYDIQKINIIDERKQFEKILPIEVQ